MQMDKMLSSVPDERHIRVRLLGTGAADPTREIGQGVTITRTASGVYKIVFNEGQGTFVGMGAPAFGAATAADVKGHTCTRGTYTSPTATAAGFLSISVWNSSFAADDLQATEYLDLDFVFSQNSEVF
jgi:hypothetical protein